MDASEPSRDVELSDEDLLILYARGDARSARELAGRLTPFVFGVAYRSLGDRAEAEDVAQEAMLRLWRVAPQWQAGRAKVTTWLYRVVSNLCTDRLRRRRRVAPLDNASEVPDGSPGAVDSMAQAERLSALREALASLPDRQREAVSLRHLEGLQNPEIARIMDISVEAVESLVARGKRALKDILAPKKEELGIGDG